MQVRTADGIELDVVEHGRGPAVILVHGFTGAKEDFTEFLPAIGAAHRAVTFDHRGHGASAKPDRLDAYSLTRLAHDVVHVADSLGIERFRLLGHSMGGMVAQLVALDVPDRVDALVLQDTCPGPIRVDRGDAELAARLALERGMRELRVLMDARDPLTTPAHERVLAERPGHKEFGDRKFESTAPAAYAALIRDMLDRPDLSGPLARLRCPTLVMVGEQDAPFLEPSRALAAAIPNAELVVIPEAGHNPQFENTSGWLDALTTFLARVAAVDADAGAGAGSPPA